MSEDNTEKVTLSKLSLEDYGVFHMFGDIDTLIAFKFRNFLYKFENLTEIEELTIYINSDGGYLSDTWSIIDAMIASKLKIKTIATGSIASAGSMIFLAGDERLMEPHCMWMSHQFSCSQEELKFHEKKVLHEVEKQTHKDMIEYYRKRTKLKKSYVEENLLGNSDFYLTAKQCLEVGLCDGLVY